MGYLVISLGEVPTDGQIIDVPATLTYRERLPSDHYGHKLVIPCDIADDDGNLVPMQPRPPRPAV